MNTIFFIRSYSIRCYCFSLVLFKFNAKSDTRRNGVIYILSASRSQQLHNCVQLHFKAEVEALNGWHMATRRMRNMASYCA